jgi:serine/threonine protein kinase
MQTLGRYEILEELGHGAMGTVYRGRDPKIARIVALKTISAKAATPKEARDYLERFYREAQSAGKMSHPGIVTIFDVGEEESTKTPYIVMEFIAGITMEDMLKTGKPMHAETALDLVKQIAEALHYAHAQGIIHRDIKPANIMVTEDGRARITDFGVAKLLNTDYTVAGHVLGTPSFMSPEQITGDPVDGRADLFALGIVLYILLSGEKPFQGDSMTQVVFKTAYKAHKPVAQLKPELRPDYDYVVSRALAKVPADRYQNGNEFAADLDDLRQGAPPRSRKTSASAGDETRAVAAEEPAAEATLVQSISFPGPSGRRAAPATSDDSDVTKVMTSSTVDDSSVLNREALEKIRNKGKRASWKWLAAGLAVLLFASAGYFYKHRPAEAPVVAEEEQSEAPVPATAPESAETSHLHLRCVHPFHNGELKLWVDNELRGTYPLRGAGIKKRYMLLKTPVMGSLNRLLPLNSGIHKIRVQVLSHDDYFDQTQQIEGDFKPGSEKNLRVGIGSRNSELNLSWQ